MSQEQFKNPKLIVGEPTVEEITVLPAEQTSNESLSPGQVVLGQYEVIKKLGEGGMSEVFRCRHLGLNQMVALKILHVVRAGSENSLRRFNQEAKATYKLNHPNIIRMLEFRDTAEGAPCIVMEYIDGKPLNELILTEGTLDFASFVRIFSQVCDGLEYAHENGVIHRDLKPSNLMIKRGINNEKDEVKIVDFGIAKVIELGQNQQLTQTGDVFGSPLYMSPEQCKGMPPDRRSDLYSLGCTMFEALTGVPPFRGQTQVQTLFMHVERPVPPLRLQKSGSATTAAAIERIVQKLMSKDPSQRFQNAIEVKKALLASLSDGAGDSSDSRKFAPLAAAVGAAIIGIAIVSLFLFRLPSPIGTTSKESTPAPNSVPASAPITAPAIATTESTVNQGQIAVQVQRLYREGIQLETAGKFTEALIPLSSGYQLSRQLSLDDINRREISVAYCAAAFQYGGDAEKAGLMPILAEVEPYMDKAPRMQNIHQSNVYGWHGVLTFYSGDYKKCLSLMEKAASLADDSHQKSQWLSWEGNCWASLGQLNKATHCYDQAEQVLDPHNLAEICALRTSRANMFLQHGQKAAAVKWLKAAKALADGGGVDPSSGQYMQLAQLLQRQNLPPITLKPAQKLHK